MMAASGGPGGTGGPSPPAGSGSSPSPSPSPSGKSAPPRGPARTAPAKSARPSGGGMTTGQILARGFPLGFRSVGQFRQFGEALKAGLKRAGFGDVEAGFQGSSVTGRSFRTGKAFDVGRVSDFDIALGSRTLLDRAKDLGVALRGGGTRTGPLTAAEIEQLGLTSMHATLTRLAGGRPVNFMIFGSKAQAAARGASIWVP